MKNSNEIINYEPMENMKFSKHMEFGKNIKMLRKEKNISQGVLAKIVGVSQDTVSLWECGKQYPDIFILWNLCLFFELGINDILGVMY